MGLHGPNMQPPTEHEAQPTAESVSVAAVSEEEADEAETDTADGAEAKAPQDPQYMEDMHGSNVGKTIESHVVLRVFARWRRIERKQVETEGGAAVSMEEKEVAHISASLTRVVMRVALALHGYYK